MAAGGGEVNGCGRAATMVGSGSGGRELRQAASGYGGEVTSSCSSVECVVGMMVKSK